MATKRKRFDLEILLADIHVPSLDKSGKNQHALTMDLVCPRPNVALKSTTKTIPLVNGRCPTQLWPWTHKICFKETVEGNFGLNVTITEKLSRTQLRKLLRFVAGKSLDVGADVVEDAVPVPFLDEIATLPIVYASKQLLAAVNAKIIAEGCLDLNANELDGKATTLVLPLSSRRMLNKNASLNEMDPDREVTFIASPI